MFCSFQHYRRLNPIKHNTDRVRKAWEPRVGGSRKKKRVSFCLPYFHLSGAVTGVTGKNKTFITIFATRKFDNYLWHLWHSRVDSRRHGPSLNCIRHNRVCTLCGVQLAFALLLRAIQANAFEWTLQSDCLTPAGNNNPLQNPALFELE